MKYYFVTTNKNKFKEFVHLFPYETEMMLYDLPELQGTINEISHSKAVSAFEHIQQKDDYMVITDDVSLEIDALGGFPGPYIKHFLKIGAEKIELIMKNFDNKQATSICALGICYKKGNEKTTKVIFGQTKGYLEFKSNVENTNAFGFDQFFVPDLFTKTYAEMSFKEKNVISHRGKAIFNLIGYIKDNKINCS